MVVGKGKTSKPLTEKELRYIYRSEFNSIDNLAYFNGEYNKVLFVNLFDAIKDFEQKAEYNETAKFTLEEIREILTDLAEEV